MKQRGSPGKSSKKHPQPVDALVYPRFSGIATFMRLPHVTRAEELDVALIGIPYDGGATYRSGPRFGPRHVREQSAIIRPWNPVLNLNPFEKLGLRISAIFRSIRYRLTTRSSASRRNWTRC